MALVLVGGALLLTGWARARRQTFDFAPIGAGSINPASPGRTSTDVKRGLVVLGGLILVAGWARSRRR